MPNRKRLVQSLNCTAFFLAQLLLFLLANQIQPALALDCGSATDIQAALSPETTVSTKGGDIAFQGARLIVSEKALPANVAIRIKRLKEEDLPPLPPFMINVTSGGGGFRFLPHGLTFQKPVNVELPLKDTFG